MFRSLFRYFTIASLSVLLLAISFSLAMQPSRVSAQIVMTRTLSRSVNIQATGTPLGVPFISQFSGQQTASHDCGPASVAMIVQFFGSPNGRRPTGISDGNFITQVRNATGNTANLDTTFPQLEHALTSYGLISGQNYREISASLSPAPDAQMQAMKNAIAVGNPVIALIHGADLNRGSAYGDHWVVVRGFSSDGTAVYLNDPDTAVSPPGIQGGQISLPYTTFRKAAQDAQTGPYGIEIGTIQKPTSGVQVQVAVALTDITSSQEVNFLTNPLHTRRTLTIQVFNSSNQIVMSTTGTVIYQGGNTDQNSSGLFVGTFNLGTNWVAGQYYQIRAKLPNTLRKSISGPYFGSYYQFVNGTNTIMPRVRLPLGDINNDNQIDILDYNILLNCMQNTGCSRGSTQYNASDLNDDGVVDGIDYNIWLRVLKTG